ASAGCTSPRVPTAANSARMAISLVQSAVLADRPIRRAAPEKRPEVLLHRSDHDVDVDVVRGTWHAVVSIGITTMNLSNVLHGGNVSSIVSASSIQSVSNRSAPTSACSAGDSWRPNLVVDG